ncbi:hypothetical protein C7S15_8260 [Burkholderia cepacia]|nr:hypothetical protein [Burkholderia cepacia]
MAPLTAPDTSDCPRTIHHAAVTRRRFVQGLLPAERCGARAYSRGLVRLTDAETFDSRCRGWRPVPA